ncbi:MAG: hypothetical protein A2Z06_01330 [Candidatus Glassbacteria bacterium RBG_16_58_8]|uniref:Uncharacterized protein n=1 Tax=Candidatus Glassbacteria bacterium RBG_16_58_8 TaxID=1817866 RepID=A0A1F5YCI3_9BACT|nr:MAG: hypothetical protein A2Z06_01330 [Candidatus Glassbacteria bacterium RBG_16_58_8]
MRIFGRKSRLPRGRPGDRLPGSIIFILQNVEIMAIAMEITEIDFDLDSEIPAFPRYRYPDGIFPAFLLFLSFNYLLFPAGHLVLSFFSLMIRDVLPYIIGEKPNRPFKLDRWQPPP